MFDQHYKKESPTFTGITRGVGGFGFGAASADDDGGGGPSATNLAEFFGVDPTTSTTVRYQYLDKRYTGEYNQPSNQWADYPKSSSGMFLSRVGLTALDGRGIWKDSASGFFATPSDIRWISSVSNESGGWYPGYTPYNVDSSSVTDGAFASSNYQDFANDGNNLWFDMVFSNGLVNNVGTPALGFVFSFYGNYSAPETGYHNNVLNRLICNGVSASFVPKGELSPNTTNSAGYGNGGFVCYPTIYDPTTVSQVNSTIGTFTYPLSSSHFVY
mgnify:FL=1